jgi:hypothetical protein
MTEAERAILKNQLVLMHIAMAEADAYSVNSWRSRIYGDLSRRIKSTEVALYDPNTMCSCTGRGPHIHTVDAGRQMFVCDFCDREVRRVGT